MAGRNWESRKRSCPGRRLGFEPLEDRRLLSVTVDLVSRAEPLSASAIGASSTNAGAVSADGRYVAFVSDAVNLVSGYELEHDVKNAYRYDRQTGEVVLVSVDWLGNSGADSDIRNIQISADGNVIAFETDAQNLHQLPHEDGGNIFARNISENVTHLVTINKHGTGTGNFEAYNFALSADGNVVAFDSRSSDLHQLDTDPYPDVFARNLATGTTHLVSINAAGTGSANSNAENPTISADGSVVAYWSYATNLHDLDTLPGEDAYARNLTTGTTYLVSVSASGTSGGDDETRFAVVSADGNHVAFSSMAANLHPLDTDDELDVYVRHLAEGTTELVSVNAEGTGNTEGSSPAINADGTVVAFSSQQDIFVRDLVAGATHLVSVSTDGLGGGNDYGFAPLISADGNSIAYWSYASNLSPDDTEDDVDLFVYNRTTQTMYLASHNNRGENNGDRESYPYDHALSADGSVVAFISEAADLVDGDFNSLSDVFAFDVGAGELQVVSAANVGLESETASGNSSNAVVSANGRYVAFVSDAPNTVSGVNITPGVDNVYRYDRVTHEVVLVSVDPTGMESGDRDSEQPGISADGSMIVFTSSATNLNSLDNSSNKDVFARDLATGTTHLVSVNAEDTASGNGHSDYPVISDDGNRVAFRSTSRDLEAIDFDTFYDIFARDLNTGTTQLVSVNAAGDGSGNRPAYTPLMSADGNVVAYLTQSNNLHQLDTDFELDLFARNVNQGVTYLVSVNAAGDGSANATIATPSISSDGTRIAFQSRASNLHSLDAELNHLDRSGDIFVRDVAAGVTHLVSINAAGTASGSNSASTDPDISADGNVVAFSSGASDLIAGLAVIGRNIFARNLATGTTTLVSATLAGDAITGDERSWDPKISADGNVVVFESDASNLHELDTDFDPEDDVDVFARNLTTGTTQLVSVNAAGSGAGNGPSFSPAVNSDGSAIVFLSDASDLVENDFNSSQDVFVGSVVWSAPLLPGDYNSDGAVDAADYIMWRKSLNTAVPEYEGADGSGNGVVDGGDHGVWAANFGASESPGAGGEALVAEDELPQQADIESGSLVVASESKENGRAVARNDAKITSRLSFPSPNPLPEGEEMQEEVIFASFVRTRVGEGIQNTSQERRALRSPFAREDHSVAHTRRTLSVAGTEPLTKVRELLHDRVFLPWVEEPEHFREIAREILGGVKDDGSPAVESVFATFKHVSKALSLPLGEDRGEGELR